MATKLQTQFNPSIAFELIKILYPDVTIEDFKISHTFKYTWVIIEAYKKAKYNGAVSPNNMIEKSLRLSFGLENNYTGGKYWGEIKKENINPKDIKFRIWKFVDDNTVHVEFTEIQISQAIKYLHSRGIHEMGINEFYKEYYKD